MYKKFKAKINDKNVEILYDEKIIGNTANDLKSKEYSNQSVAEVKMDDKNSYYLYINGESDDKWFEIVKYCSDNEVDFSDCIYEKIQSEKYLIELFANYIKER